MNFKIETLTCPPELAGVRLDKFIFNTNLTISRSSFHKLIKTGGVKINEKIIQKPSHLLKTGDTILITVPQKKEYDLTPYPIDFEVIDVQKDFIIINKPAGLVVHAGEYNKDEVSLVNGLLYYFKELKELIDENDVDDARRPGIIHRIDRHTSGLLVVARTKLGAEQFKKMFHDRQIHKAYTAIVSGHPPQEGQIDCPIGRNNKERHKMACNGINSRYALTKYKTLEYFKDYSLVKAIIVTGRTHQIRVHFSSIGHPIVGDSTYGKPSKLIARQALHASQLSFYYGNKEFKYTVPLAQDLSELVFKLYPGRQTGI